MVCVRALCLERYAGLQSGIPLQKEHTYKIQCSEKRKCVMAANSICGPKFVGKN